jgi:cytidine deaminase
MLDRPTAEALLERAREARARAYVPYSRFPVGAALLAADGTIVTGCNVENASYGLTNCAERTAIFKAVSEGVHDFRAIAVVGPDGVPPSPPCGACRQVLSEFGPEMVVVTAGVEPGAPPALHTVAELLPHAFGPAWLEARQEKNR